MIHARIVFEGKNIEILSRSIEPDNLPNMNLDTNMNQFCINFSTERIGTLLSTIDDLLMNIKIAEAILISAEDR